MSSNLDVGLIYRPPNTLQFPKGMEPFAPKEDSRAGSPDSSSSSQSDLSFSPTLKRADQINAELDPVVLTAHLEADETLSVVSVQMANTEEDDETFTQPAVAGHSPGGRFPKTPVRLTKTFYSIFKLYLLFCLLLLFYI